MASVKGSDPSEGASSSADDSDGGATLKRRTLLTSVLATTVLALRHGGDYFNSKDDPVQVTGGTSTR